MEIYLLLEPSYERSEPVTTAYLHRSTWLWSLRRRYHDTTANVNPSSLSDNELIKYIHTSTDDSAIVCTLIGPDLDLEPGYERVVVLARNGIKVYSNPSCLPQLQDTDDLSHIPVDKVDINNPIYDSIRDKML
jgi:uncharacterized membrane protein